VGTGTVICKWLILQSFTDLFNYLVWYYWH
jgi:hypothetical protein